jgi:quercetin dioxygenase-like cupin family protein
MTTARARHSGHFFARICPTSPAHTFTSAIVDFAPGVRAAPHTHGEAFVYAYVLKGSVRSQLDDEPAKVYRTGEKSGSRTLVRTIA